jgi:hypothetical protein
MLRLGQYGRNDYRHDNHPSASTETGKGDDIATIDESVDVDTATSYVDNAGLRLCYIRKDKTFAWHR